MTQDQKPAYGRIIITSGGATQYAWEADTSLVEESNKSLFTHFLIKGLEGEADLDKDGKITVDELYNYIYEQVINITPQQTPSMFSYKQEGRIILRENNKSISEDVDKNKKSPRNQLKVFLCHSVDDKPTVRELYQRLSQLSWIDVWLDEEKIFPGQDWEYEIEKALDNSDAVIVSLSRGSITKEGYVQRELRFVIDIALQKPEGTIFILPVRLEQCEPPRKLRSYQYADYFPKEQRDRAYQRLLASLKMRAISLGIVNIDNV